MMKDDSGLRQEAMPYLVLAAELGLVHVLPGDELDAWDLVLGEKDDFNRIPEKIELGMKCSPEHRKQALIEHPLAKGGSFLLPVEVVALLGAYDQFDTRKLNELKSKVTEKARTKTESSAGLKALKDVLMNRSGEVFVARGTKEKDTLYQLFDTAAKQASGILDTLR